jgi:hypothetical protein
MNTKEIRILILWHVLFFVCGTLFFIMLFHTTLFERTVLFYRGILLLGLASTVVFAFLLFFKKTVYGKNFTIRDVILSVVVVFCLNLVFFTHVPVTADRSLSVFLLGYMNNHSDEVLSKDKITEVFVQKYIYENEALGKRFNEQIVSGNIRSVDDTYVLTEQGKSVMKFYTFIAGLFVINQKNISP